MSNLIRLDEVAEICGIHKTTVSGYIKKGILPANTSGSIGNGSPPMLWNKREVLEGAFKLNKYREEKKLKKEQTKNYQDIINLENNKGIKADGFNDAMSLFDMRMKR